MWFMVCCIRLTHAWSAGSVAGERAAEEKVAVEFIGVSRRTRCDKNFLSRMLDRGDLQRPMVKNSLFFLLAGFAVITPGFLAAEDALPEKVSFNRDIRPILSENCFHCHGPDPKHREADRRLDLREAALAENDGIRAIVPGDVEDSDAIERVFSKDKDEVMPPPKSHRTLDARQMELLKRWVEQGAVYEPHWAYTTPKRPEVPSVNHAASVRNPIDVFVLRRLEKEGLDPSPEADSRDLCRRLYLDLTGLPPTPEQASEFASAGYETVVDQLLASPHYGERMAVPWLDAVRFADTVGYHGDQNINIFPYRDYVIDAFNHNKPFDQFTIEQLAGDLLPNPTPEQLIATGFNRLNLMTREGGAQPKEYLVKYGADRVRTVASAFMGATMGCAECHDHKFDPIKQSDFYALSAFFADIKQWGVYADYDYTPNPDLRGYNNDYPFPPEIEIESPALHQRIERYSEQLRSLAAAADEPAFTAWREAARGFLADTPTGWKTPDVADTRDSEMEKNETQDSAVMESDGRIVLPGQGATKDVLELTPAPGTVAAVKIEILPDPRSGPEILRSGVKSMTLKTSLAWQKKDADKPTPLAIRQADADRKVPRYESGFEILGIVDQWKLASGTDAAAGVWLLDPPIEMGDGDNLIVTLEGNAAASLRVSVSPFATPTPTADLTPLASQLGSNIENARVTWMLSTGKPPGFPDAKALCDRIAECRGGKAWTLVTEAVDNPLVIRVLPRGDWQNDSGDVVEPHVPGFLPQISNPEGRRLTRLDLARWLMAPENPLTARVFVNRLWKQFFGNGISAQVDDFGSQGEWPSHPDLLDWLAVEFRESGWDVKHMIKLIVTSATYRQSALLRRELLETDPQNRLLASQNPRRLEAEFVRDNALFAAGLIDLEVGGPSAKPYQPADYYAQIQFPDRHYVADPGPDQYRRGLYTHWQRTFLHPMLANFDAPSREETACTRNVANTPQQALTLLNDPTFTEAARVLAARVLAAADRTDPQRLNDLFARLINRAPTDKEERSLLAFLGTQRDHFEENVEDAKSLTTVGNSPPAANLDPVELASWTSVCRVALNLHEAITRY